MVNLNYHSSTTRTYGCSNCQFTSDHPIAKTICIWRICLWIWEIGGFFPNVIGAIDGLHLEIELTEERTFEPSFINYKQFHSLHLQVSSLPKKSLFTIGKLSQHIQNVLIQVCFWISNQKYFSVQLSQYIHNIPLTRSKMIEKKVCVLLRFFNIVIN